MMQSGVDLNDAFRELTAKYAVDTPTQWKCATNAASCDESVMLVPGWTLLAANAEASRYIPLLPWRTERRFVELKRLVDSHTIESVTMCRLSCQTTGEPLGLKAILYRELDLVEWLTGSPIVALHASIAAERFANVLVRVANGVVCSVEAGATLPANAQPPMIDRHEIIAQRGVASDRVVDSQLPQSSVYTFTADGMASYTDTDAELFGMDQDDISLVRAAFELAARPAQVDACRHQHQRLVQLIDLAWDSDRLRQRLFVKGVGSCNR